MRFRFTIRWQFDELIPQIRNRVQNSDGSAPVNLQRPKENENNEEGMMIMAGQGSETHVSDVTTYQDVASLISGDSRTT